MRELKETRANSNNHDVKIVTSEAEIIALARLGYDCQPIGFNKWLMKKVKDEIGVCEWKLKNYCL